MKVYNNIYGHIEFTEPVFKELLKTPEMQRLKGVLQCPSSLFNLPQITTTRFEHSMGTAILVRRLGGPVAEQIAALLHDISHTAFSHTADYLFDASLKQDVADKRIRYVVMNSKIPQILKKHSFDVDYILNQHNFPLLERNLPNLCADRLDYCLRDCLALGYMVPAEVDDILNALTTKNNEIVFKSKQPAEKFARIFLQISGDFYIANEYNDIYCDSWWKKG